MNQTLSLTLAAIVGVGCLAVWYALYVLGRRYALRDPLQQCDAIVSVAGTLGNIDFINGKADTAASLYREGWAPIVFFAGRWSHRVNQREPNLISPSEIEEAVKAGRIDDQTAALAASTWDLGLDAEYMRMRAIQAGVPDAAILTECQSLHTLENARFSAPLLAERGVRRVILVTSPFHQRRAYLTFAKVYDEYHIEVRNYAASTRTWHALTWFFSKENRRLVRGEARRIRTYTVRGDLVAR